MADVVPTAGPARTGQQSPPGTPLGRRPTTRQAAAGLVEFRAPRTQTDWLPDDTMVIEADGGVTITQLRPQGDLLELHARTAVLFTTIKRGEMGGDKVAAGADVNRRIKAVYLEGDVVMNYEPALPTSPEQRLTAERIYYDFPSDRAILTSVVMHSLDPEYQAPVMIRAAAVQQLSQGEMEGRQVEISSSYFATPTYSIKTSYAYIRQEAGEGNLVNFNFLAQDATVNFWDMPLFYFPQVAGVANNGPMPLRDLQIGQSNQLGWFVMSKWGLFELAGQNHPKDLDVSVDLDEYTDRGIGGGLDAKYKGGLLTNGPDPWSYDGDVSGYYILG